MAWSSQYKRVKRWYSRIENNKLDSKYKYDDFQYLDFLYAYFQNCWHLKDWLLNDTSVKVPDKTIKDFFESTPSLKACRDIALTSKHLDINNRHVDKSRKIDSGSVTITWWDDEVNPDLNRRIRYMVFSEENGEHVDALQLAKTTLKDINNFIAKHKIEATPDQIEILQDLIKEHLEKNKLGSNSKS